MEIFNVHKENHLPERTEVIIIIIIIGVMTYYLLVNTYLIEIVQVFNGTGFLFGIFIVNTLRPHIHFYLGCIFVLASGTRHSKNFSAKLFSTKTGKCYKNNQRNIVQSIRESKTKHDETFQTIQRMRMNGGGYMLNVGKT